MNRQRRDDADRSSDQSMVVTEHDRRTEPRYRTNAHGLFHMPGLEPWWPCRVLDVSRSGVRIRCARQLSAGTAIRVIILPGEEVLVCQVRHGQPDGPDWTHGLRILRSEGYDSGFELGNAS